MWKSVSDAGTGHLSADGTDEASGSNTGSQIPLPGETTPAGAPDRTGEDEGAAGRRDDDSPREGGGADPHQRGPQGVHSHPPGGDHLVDKGRCQSAGTHCQHPTQSGETTGEWNKYILKH